MNKKQEVNLFSLINLYQDGTGKIMLLDPEWITEFCKLDCTNGGIFKGREVDNLRLPVTTGDCCFVGQEHDAPMPEGTHIARHQVSQVTNVKVGVDSVTFEVENPHTGKREVWCEEVSDLDRVQRVGFRDFTDKELEVLIELQIVFTCKGCKSWRRIRAISGDKTLVTLDNGDALLRKQLVEQFTYQGIPGGEPFIRATHKDPTTGRQW
jgi:hypothetical protein